MKTDTILDLIRMLSAQGATGSMLINTGTTAGAISFDRGDIMSAWLGKLTGFQAINALASLRDATYDFDHTITGSEHGRLTPNERMLLRDFYGIQPGEPDPSSNIPLESWEEDPAPERVIPLSSLEDPESHLPEPTQDDQDATVVRRKSVEARRTRPVSRSFLAPALIAILLAVVVGLAAVALVQRLRRRDSTPSVGPTAETAVNTASPAPSPTTEETRPDLSGNWKVINTVEQTSYKAYQNMEVGFNLSINQSGNDFTGTGEKISENGQNLPAHGRTPIEVKGTIDGDKIVATFVETGTLRKTNGRFVWRIDKGGLTGTFNSTAARTSGRSAATKKS